MSRLITFTTCSGCFPVYQPNQLAHSEPGGCLWCASAEENNLLTVDGPLDTLFETGSDDIVETGTAGSEVTLETEDSFNVNECCICYENIDALKNNCTTECGHKFCFKCLATSMVHNNFSCPCCRTQLVESSEEDDEEEEEDEDEDEDEEGEEEDGEDVAECNVEDLTLRLEASGFKMQDLLSMLLGRYAKDAADIAIYEMNKRFDAIIDEADGEAFENEAMGQEDTRRMEVAV
jgi:hypothetical protein